MKICRFLLKHSILFILTLAVTGFVFLGIVSFFAVDQLQSAPKNSEHNLNAVLKIGKSYLSELSTFDSLHQTLEHKQMPPVCSTLCNPVVINQGQLITERTPYLESYYKVNGTNSFKDPLFRFKLEQMSAVSKAIPTDLREVFTDILEENPKQSKLQLALRLEAAILTALPSLPQHYETFREESNRLTLVRAWMKACRVGGNAKKISQECRTEFP
ncbi:MAG: hypothetical protein ACM3MG_01970 [Bacillota bacterium]